VRALAVLLATLAAATAAAQSNSQMVAITGGRVVPVEGPDLPSGTVLISAGKIAAVG
jgi:imidazolonepropionase-like amidohydrolase